MNLRNIRLTDDVELTTKNDKSCLKYNAMVGNNKAKIYYFVNEEDVIITIKNKDYNNENFSFMVYTKLLDKLDNYYFEKYNIDTEELFGSLEDNIK